MTVTQNLRLSLVIATLLVTGALTLRGQSDRPGFDHDYRALERILAEHVEGSRVDYASLTRDRAPLDAVVEQLGQVTANEFERWSVDQQMAYLINAYNTLTLQAIVDHYPIDGGWLSFLRWAPRNSIKQIDGVWDERRWLVAGSLMTLDEVEHGTLRVRYDEPRIHFAVNCAAISCPPLRRQPYRADQLDRQLIVAARDFLASALGVQIDGTTLRVSRIFDWYGDDFIADYAHLIDTDRSDRHRATLGVIAKYGPAEAARLAGSAGVTVDYLRYDWGLNDLERP